MNEKRNVEKLEGLLKVGGESKWQREVLTKILLEKLKIECSFTIRLCVKKC